MFQLKVGDKVEWTSQSSGVVKTKTGVVIWVVPAGSSPPSVQEMADVEGLERIPTRRVKFCTNGARHGLPVPRTRDSYVIRVGKDYYYPVPKLLRKVAR